MPGGPSFYTALMARSLGAAVTLVTGMEQEFPREALEGVDLRVSAAALPRYANAYGQDGVRTQILLVPGDELHLLGHLAGVPEPDLVIYAPAYHEFRKAPLRFRGAVVGVALQGALRMAAADGRVRAAAEPLRAVLPLVRPGWVAMFSEEDAVDAEGLAGALAGRGVLAVLTRGHNGATLFEPDGTTENWPALTANAVDPTGAGDCFAAAFMVRLAETGDPRLALPFALAAGALAVEHPGAAGVASRAAIEARMDREAA